MAILTIIPSLNTVGNAFISLFFPNQCLVCKKREFFSHDPICQDSLQHMTSLSIGNRVQELTVNDGIDIALSSLDFGDGLRTAGANIIVALTLTTPLEKKDDTYAESV